MECIHSSAEHYVSVPEERFDVVESMVERLDEMESKLNEQIERNVALNTRLSEVVSEDISLMYPKGSLRPRRTSSQPWLKR